MNARPLIEAAITIAGSQVELGKACGVTQGAIWKAKQAGQVSAELAIKIERATNSAIPRWKLRPDLWDAPVPAPLAADGGAGAKMAQAV